MGANMYVMNTYGPLYGASAIAGVRFLSYLLAVAFPLFAIQSKFHQTFTIQLARSSSLLLTFRFLSMLHTSKTSSGFVKACR